MNEDERRPCPRCGALHYATDTVCLSCGADLTDERPRQEPPRPETSRRQPAISLEGDRQFGPGAVRRLAVCFVLVFGWLAYFLLAHPTWHNGGLILLLMMVTVVIVIILRPKLQREAWWSDTQPIWSPGGGSLYGVLLVLFLLYLVWLATSSSGWSGWFDD